MFDIGLGEIIALAAVALLVFGPDQLPKVAAQAGRLLRDVRTMAASARQELSDSAGMDEISKDLKSLTDLHPKRLMSSVWEDPTADDAKPGTAPAGGQSAATSAPGGGAPDSAEANAEPASKKGGADNSPPPPSAAASSPSYDPDAT